jgi:hypothetical protein
MAPPVRFIVAFWNLLTYRTGGELPPPRPIPRPTERIRQQVIEGELLMLVGAAGCAIVLSHFLVGWPS